MSNQNLEATNDHSIERETPERDVDSDRTLDTPDTRSETRVDWRVSDRGWARALLVPCREGQKAASALAVRVASKKSKRSRATEEPNPLRMQVAETKRIVVTVIAHYGIRTHGRGVISTVLYQLS